MPVLRTDIERALDDLISNEAGMTFQGLAVILAKQRWPELIACERKKDLGADAFGAGRALACSLTAKLGKISGDATKIKKHFKATTLVFATPEGVSNTTAENWAAEIRKDFGYELVLMPREDIITSLLNPANLALCRTILGIPVTLDPPLEELLAHVKEAAVEVLNAWSVRLAGKPLIDLRAVTIHPEENEGGDGTDVLHLEDFKREMLQSRRLVIEAPAGRGKTTTLVQLAARQSGSGNVAFLIDMPAWLMMGTGILQYIAGIPEFQSRSITPDALARLQKVQHFSFLLNGWNEVSESDSVRAVQSLRELERHFPAAGILVATRTHHIVPPLPGALRTRLLPVNREERNRYLDQFLGSKADELRVKLDSDPLLDELTRTPLILSAIAVIFAAGAPIPHTKMGVLESVMRLHEQSDEHRSQLQVPPLSGRAQEYLSGLAAVMMEHGAVTLAEDSARTAAHSVAAKLRDAGQLGALPEPQSVLNALSAHHVLERLTYPIAGFRFQHQQFQEFYAAQLLKRQLKTLVGKENPRQICEFTKRYTNEPAWSAPLRMIANEIGVATVESQADTESIGTGALLVRMALKADPVFAAELGYLCGAYVWREVGDTLSQNLRTMYSQSDEHCRQLALAGMLASGSEDFKDIILPILANDDQQVRLEAYRTWPDFHLSSLGPDWQKNVRGWNEEVRSDFVSELLHFANVREPITLFALADPSLKVRIEALSAFTWGGSQEEIVKLLASVDDDTFKAALPQLPLETIPVLISARALSAYRESYQQSTDPFVRARTLLLIAQIGTVDVISDLKDELNRFPRITLANVGDYVTRPALDLIRQTDREWVSHWVAERIGDGSLYPDFWIRLVSVVPEEMKERLLGRLETEDFKHAQYSGPISVLAAVCDAAMVERVFARLCTLREVIAGAPEETHEMEWAVERQLEGLFHAFPDNISVESLAGHLSEHVQPLELIVLTRLYSRVGRKESDLRKTLRNNSRQMLRGYLLKGVPIVLREDDFSGEQKANLGSSLAQVGEPEDLPLLQDLIRADIARMRRGREAWMHGDRSRLGNGGIVSWAPWHVRSLLQIAPDTADEILLELLKEPQYEREAAWGLVQLAITSKFEPGLGFGFGFGYSRPGFAKIWEARQGQLLWNFDEERGRRYAGAIRQQVENLLDESRNDGRERAYDFRLKELIKALAFIDSRNSSDFILNLLCSQDDWNGGPVVQALETLLFNGIVLPTDKTLEIFNILLGHMRSHLWDDQAVGLLMRAICLLPYIEDAAAGITKVREVMAELRRRPYQVRDVAAALGYSHSREAVQVLQEFGSDEILIRQLGDTWINAVAELDYPESRQLLMSFVDPVIPELPARSAFDRDDAAAARLAELALRDSAVRERIFQLCAFGLPSPKRELLAKVVGMMATTEAVLAGLNLIDDTATPAVPYQIWKALEETFVEHKAVGAKSNMHTLVPRSSNSIRTKLLEMAKRDARRKSAASSLLCQIDGWRLEYGRPNGEPRNPGLECS
jgi:hypothetical protein